MLYFRFIFFAIKYIFLLILLPAPSVLFDNQTHNTEANSFDFAIYSLWHSFYIAFYVYVCDSVDYEIGVALKMNVKDVCFPFMFTFNAVKNTKKAAFHQRRFVCWLSIQIILL